MAPKKKIIPQSQIEPLENGVEETPADELADVLMAARGMA